MNRLLFGGLLVSWCCGCAGKGSPGATSTEDASTFDASADTTAASDTSSEASTETSTDASKAAGCASTFGTALTDAFGRIDGTVVAIVGPTDLACPMPNSTHVVVQVRMKGDVYRMVVNVQSDRGTDPNVRFATISHGFVGDPWTEGWHPGVAVDYPTTLGVHSDATFTALPMTDVVAKVEDAIPLGAKISVYATSSGGASAHLVHRNGANHDGAIVLDPDAPSSKWMLFHFAEQTF